MNLDLLNLSLGTTLLAHVLYGLPDLWPAVLGSRRVTLHNGDDFSPRDEAPRLERLRNPRLVARDSTAPVELRTTASGAVEARLDGIRGPEWFVVETEPAFIELAPREFESYLEHEGLSAALRSRQATGTADRPGREIYSKYAKVAFDTGQGFGCDEIGLPIEIVPVGGEACRVGDEIHVRVVRRGCGAFGLQLQATHRALDGTTSRVASTQVTLRDGTASIRIDAPGFWRLHTIAMEPNADPSAADWRSHWASLTFHVLRTEDAP